MQTSQGNHGRVGPDRQYSQGIELYQHGFYEQAASVLAGLRRRGDLLGDVGTYYEGMAYRGMAIEALRAGQWSSAEKHLLNAADALGGRSGLADYFAVLYAHTGRHENCRAVTEQVCNPTDPVAHARRIAHGQWRAGRREEALLTVREALRTLGPSSDLLVQLGLFHAAEDDLDAARDAMSEAIEADCSDGRAYYHLGLVEAAAGSFATALQALQRALELRPTDLKLAYQLAWTARVASESGYRVSLRLPEGHAHSDDSPMRQMAAYLTQEPDFTASFLSLPKSHADGELFGMLADVLRLALSDHGNYADLNYYMSAVLERLDRPTEALSYARRAVRINGSYVKALLLCGRLLARLGDDDRAVEHLRRAIASGGDWADVHCHVAELLLRKDARYSARKHLSRALKLNPHYTRAARTMHRLAA